MKNGRLLFGVLISVFVFVLLYFFLRDNFIGVGDLKRYKIHQILDEGYTYRLDWIPGQDKLLAYLDGYLEVVDIWSGRREKILKLNEREVNGYQPLNISSDGTMVILKEDEDIIIFYLKMRIKEKAFTDSSARTFSWSPDNKNFVYESNNDIYIYSMKAKQIKRLTFDQEYWHPHWASIGNLIAFRDYRKNGLWVIRANGTKSKKLISNGIYTYQWYPNREKEICYSRRGRDEYSLFIVNINNSKINKLYDLDFPAERDISPDGKRIALTKETISGDVTHDILSDQDVKDVDIILADISPKILNNITQSPNEMEISPNWSPDGKKILAFRVKNYNEEKPIPIVIEVND